MFQRTIRFLARRYDFLAILALMILVLGFFWRMVFTDLILPRGDVFTYFYPYWEYRSAALRAGHLPLWNPLLFMGVPFLANSQAGVLYPPNWLLIPFNTPIAVKIAIVTHVIWAGIGTYLFARNILKTSFLASLLAGTCFALGGYLTAQIEHVNQLQGLAWLPWLFWLWLDALKNKKSILWLSIAWAFQLLAGHTQSAFISGFGLAIWGTARAATSFIPSLRRESRSSLTDHWKNLSWQPLIVLAIAAVLGAALAAAQILPTVELASLSNRGGGLPFLDAVSFSLRPQLIGRSLLPGYRGQSLSSEYVAYSGIATLVLAFLGSRSRQQPQLKRELILLGLAGIFLSLGAYNPIYWGLVKILPGFDLFRAPARWLVLWNFSVALLAALGLDRLALREGIDKRGLVVAGISICALALLTPLAALSANEVPGASIPTLTEVIFWLSTLILVIMLVVLGSRPKGSESPVAITGLAALVTIEMFLAARALPYNHLSSPEAWNSQRPSISTLLAAEKDQTPPARFLSMSDTRFDPGDLREIRDVYTPFLTEDSLYDYIIATKQKEILAPNLPMAWSIPSMDGFDGGILPTRSYSRFSALFSDGVETPDGRLREVLKTIPQPYWLSISNVRYVITDKVFDAWIDGIYYDLQFTVYQHNDPALISPQPVSAEPDQPFEATSVGIIGHLEGATNIPQGTQIGTVSIDWQGMSSTDLPLALPLAVGKDFAAGDGSSPAANESGIVGYYSPQDPTLGEYRALVDWGIPLPIDRIEIAAVSSFPATLAIRGMTLIDGRSQAFLPLAIFPDIQTIQSGDVKIYEYSNSRARAYVICNPILVQGQEEALNALPQASIEDRVVIEDESFTRREDCDPSAAGIVQFTTYEPEHITITVESLEDNSYLILSDIWYPGWSAEVDEQQVEILRANAIFRAVRLPPGNHTVEFRYQSTPLMVGFILSAISLIGVIVGLLWWRPSIQNQA